MVEYRSDKAEVIGSSPVTSTTQWHIFCIKLKNMKNNNNNIPTMCSCWRKKPTCDNSCATDINSVTVVVLDLKPETHRNASDCTCYECMRKETRDFFKNEQIKTITYELG